MVRTCTRDTAVIVEVPIRIFKGMPAVSCVVTSTQATRMVGNAVAIIKNALLGLGIAIQGTIIPNLFEFGRGK